MVVYACKKYRWLLAFVYSVAVFQSKRMTDFVGTHMLGSNLRDDYAKWRLKSSRINVVRICYLLHKIQFYTIPF